MAKRRCFLAIFGLCPFRNLFPQFNCVIKPPCADGLLTAAKKKTISQVHPILCTPAVKKSAVVATLCTYPCVLIVLHMCRGLLAS